MLFLFLTIGSFILAVALSARIIDPLADPITDTRTLHLAQGVAILAGLLASIVSSWVWWYIKRYRPLRNMERQIPDLLTNQDISNKIDQILCNIARNVRDTEKDLDILYGQGVGTERGSIQSDRMKRFKEKEEGLQRYSINERRFFLKCYDQFQSWVPGIYGEDVLQDRDWRHYANQTDETKKSA